MDSVRRGHAGAWRRAGSSYGSLANSLSVSKEPESDVPHLPSTAAVVDDARQSTACSSAPHARADSRQPPEPRCSRKPLHPRRRRADRRVGFRSRRDAIRASSRATTSTATPSAAGSTRTRFRRTARPGARSPSWRRESENAAASRSSKACPRKRRAGQQRAEGRRLLSRLSRHGCHREARASRRRSRRSTRSRLRARMRTSPRSWAGRTAGALAHSRRRHHRSEESRPLHRRGHAGGPRPARARLLPEGRREASWRSATKYQRAHRAHARRSPARRMRTRRRSRSSSSKRRSRSSTGRSPSAASAS